MINQISRKSILKLVGGAASMMPASRYAKVPSGRVEKKGRIALQLYSIRRYVKRVGLAQTLKDVAAVGYDGVESAGFDRATLTNGDLSAKDFKRFLDDNGLFDGILRGPGGMPTERVCRALRGIRSSPLRRRTVSRGCR